MIDINFSIDNIWSDQSWVLVRNWAKPITKNKTFEFTLNRNRCFLNVNFSITYKKDHAGLRIDLGLFGWGVEMAICDNRHWDRKGNWWQL